MQEQEVGCTDEKGGDEGAGGGAIAEVLVVARADLANLWGRT